MYRKRHRTTFSQQQLSILEEAFKQTTYPSASLREAIALETNLDTSRVQVWFQNRRAKHKRQVSRVIRTFTYTTSGDSSVVPLVPAAALEAALSGDDFCIAEQIIAETCVNELSSCYEEAYESMTNQFVHQHHNPNTVQNNHQQPDDQPQFHQQLESQHHKQQQEQQQQQLDQEPPQQRQHFHDQESRNQYYSHYRQQIGSLRSTMTEFLQS